MDESEVKAFVEALAEFHASTYYVMSQHCDGKSGFLNDHKGLKCIKDFDPNHGAMMRQSNDHIQSNIEAIVRELVDDNTANKIQRFRPHAYDIWCEKFMKPHGKFQTIIHGDSWFNNAMFK